MIIDQTNDDDDQAGKVGRPKGFGAILGKWDEKRSSVNAWHDLHFKLKMQSL